MYCLEILRKIEDEDEMLARDGIFEHVGYEHRVDPSTGHRQIFRFRTKEEAAQYYDENKRRIGHGYPDDEPLRARRASGKNLIDARTFDYGVLARFEAAGVTDAAYHWLGEDATRRGTFPTRLLEHARAAEQQQRFLERIDFVLLSPAALARLEGVEMPRGGALDQVTDHYPVVVTLSR